MTTPLERKYIRRRLARKHLAPVRTQPTKDAPMGNPLLVTTEYGIKGGWLAGYHTGEDYACLIGSQAVAVSWGRVVQVGSTTWGSAYGTCVIIRTATGRYDYAYCHLSNVLVSVGDRVRPGTVVGLTGDTGNTTGPHCHFEVRVANGRYKDDVAPRRVRGPWKKEQ